MEGNQQSQSIYSSKNNQQLQSSSGQSRGKSSTGQTDFSSTPYNDAFSMTESATKKSYNKEDSAIYKESGNTITVQSSKVVGGCNYSFVSVSPTKKSMVDTQVIKHIKQLQQNEIKTCQNVINNNASQNKKLQKTFEYFKMENERFKVFLEGIVRYKDWEDEKLIQQTTNNNQQNQQPIQQQHVGAVNLKGSEYMVFKPLRDPSILMRDGISILTYNKGSSSTNYDQQDLLFKLVKSDSKLVKAILETNGFSQTESHDWNILWTCQSAKQYMYEGLNEYQKINHFPNSFELTRKDRLCFNVVKMQEKFGKDKFNIIPDTYILPDEFADFYSHFHMLKSKELPNNWIIKPSNSSQGKGIYIIDDISDAPIDEQCIVSRYVHNPLLINGLKFDMRLYVLVTSMDPWRFYIYNEGLARFASEPYNAQSVKSNKFAHLTNFSINKKNDKYQANMAADQDDQGHKWSLTALSKHLEQLGIDMNLLWSKIYDVIIKSFLSVDSHISQQLKKLNLKNNCFELLGFDVMIDNDLKPWLLEVNLSPSLATDSPLDLKIKQSLFIDALNLMGMKKFDRRRDNITKMKNRVKNIMRAKSYQSRQNYPGSAAPSKHIVFKGGDDKNRKGQAQGTTVQMIGEQGQYLENEQVFKNKVLFDKIQQMNSKLRDIVKDSLHENFRKTNFIRIYPTRNSDLYDQFFLQSKPSNRILHRHLFLDEIVPYPQSSSMYPSSNKAIIKNAVLNYQQINNFTRTSQEVKNQVSRGEKMAQASNIKLMNQQQQSQKDTINQVQTNPSHLDTSAASNTRDQLPMLNQNSSSLQQNAQSVVQNNSRQLDNQSSKNFQDQSILTNTTNGGNGVYSNNTKPISVSQQDQNRDSITGQQQQVPQVMNRNSSAKLQNNGIVGQGSNNGGNQKKEASTALGLQSYSKSDKLGQSSQQQALQSSVTTNNQLSTTTKGGTSTSKYGDTDLSENSNSMPLKVGSIKQNGQFKISQQPSETSQQTNNSGQTPSGISSTNSNNPNSSTSQANQSSSSTQNTHQQKEKLLITGDDVLIEYVARLMIAVKSIKESMLRQSWKNSIEKFVKHYVWHTSDVRRAANNKLWQRLESRLIEMKERRKRLLQSLYKREHEQKMKELKNMIDVSPKASSNNLNSSKDEKKQNAHLASLDFQKDFQFKEDQKNVIIQGFSAAQLEEMLKTSTKNVAYEVISCLIDQKGNGVLTEIINWLTTSEQQNLLNDTESSILDHLSFRKGQGANESDEETESMLQEPYNQVHTSTIPNQSNSKQNNSNIEGHQGSSNRNSKIRIKIRKNSIEPNKMIKANQQQIIKKKIQQYNQSTNSNKQQDTTTNTSQQQSVVNTSAQGLQTTTNTAENNNVSSQQNHQSGPSRNLHQSKKYGAVVNQFDSAQEGDTKNQSLINQTQNSSKDRLLVLQQSQVNTSQQQNLNISQQQITTQKSRLSNSPMPVKHIIPKVKIIASQQNNGESQMLSTPKGGQEQQNSGSQNSGSQNNNSNVKQYSAQQIKEHSSNQIMQVSSTVKKTQGQKNIFIYSQNPSQNNSSQQSAMKDNVNKNKDELILQHNSSSNQSDEQQPQQLKIVQVIKSTKKPVQNIVPSND